MDKLLRLSFAATLKECAAILTGDFSMREQRAASDIIRRIINEPAELPVLERPSPETNNTSTNDKLLIAAPTRIYREPYIAKCFAHSTKDSLTPEEIWHIAVVQGYLVNNNNKSRTVKIIANNLRKSPNSYFPWKDGSYSLRKHVANAGIVAAAE